MTFATNEIYVLSTLDENPVPQLILPETSRLTWLSGVSLSPDLQPYTPGYQGAIAFVLVEGSTEYRSVLTVAFAEDEQSGLEVDASSIVQARKLSDRVATPVWSHDGLEIAFLYHSSTYPGHGNSLEALGVRFDSGRITLLEDNVRTIYDTTAWVDLYGPDHAVINRPSWSPDDLLIGFCAVVGVQREGGWAYDLFRVQSDGAGAVNLTNGSGRPIFVDWNPNWIFDLQ
jgi:hypothetical protein